MSWQDAVLTASEIAGLTLVPEGPGEIYAAWVEAYEADNALEIAAAAAAAAAKTSDVMSQYGRGGSAAGNKRGPPPQHEPPMTAGGGPATQPRESSSVQVTTHAMGSQTDGDTSMEIVTPKNSVLTSGLTASLKYFDSNLLQSPGEKSLVRLQVKLGKQVYPDCITPFLKNLSGSGKIRMQFGGRCLAPVNTRHVHMQAFRHRLSTNTDTTTTSWPTGTQNRILTPFNPVAFKPAGPATTGIPYLAGTTSLRDMVTGNVYYAPYNKADLEDLSWNLNALKLGNTSWATGATLPSFEPNVPLFASDSHARQSRIAQNNQQVATIPDASPPTTGAVAPYRYNAVFNKGSILYNFMNKGLGGAKVDLVIYRTKKSGQAAMDWAGTYLGTNSGIPLDRIVIPIGAGYMNTAITKGATDALGGRPPTSSDIFSNPAFPFLPEMKKTQQSQLPFTEVCRQTFAMPSGSRRDVNIVLPGAVYDPCSITGGVGFALPAAPAYPEVFDEGTYCIVMSVSGQKCTQELTNAASDAFNVADMYAGADIQFYCTYQEHMGACQYKQTSTAQMYTGGSLLIPDPPAGLKPHPITMLPQNQAVRLPATQSGVAGTNLGNDLTAAA